MLKPDRLPAHQPDPPLKGIPLITIHDLDPDQREHVEVVDASKGAPRQWRWRAGTPESIKRGVNPPS